MIHFSTCKTLYQALIDLAASKSALLDALGGSRLGIRVTTFAEGCRTLDFGPGLG